jgi:hypothetical protein
VLSPKIPVLAAPVRPVAPIWPQGAQITRRHAPEPSLAAPRRAYPAPAGATRAAGHPTTLQLERITRSQRHQLGFGTWEEARAALNPEPAEPAARAGTSAGGVSPSWGPPLSTPSSRPPRQPWSAPRWAENPLFSLPAASADPPPSSGACAARARPAPPAPRPPDAAAERSARGLVGPGLPLSFDLDLADGTMAEATSLTQVPTQFRGALDAQQHDRFDVFVPQMLRAADVCVDGQRKMLRCSNTEQMLQLISDVFFKPYGRAHTIFGAACSTVEIREDCTGADLGLYPQRGVLQLTLQQIAGPATHCLADDEWERALSTQLREGLPNPHFTAADAPLPAATAALTPAHVHARHFTADGRARSDAEATPLHPRNLAYETPPASQAVAPAADAEPGVAEPSAPHSVTVQLRVGGPDNAAEQRDRLLIDALTGLTQRIMQPPSLPREPPLELRPNGEGRKLSAPATVLYKVVLLLKALLHPDPRAATAAFYSIAQAAGEPLDAYLSRVERLPRYTLNVSQHAKCQVAHNGMADGGGLKAWVTMRLQAAGTAEWSIALLSRLAHEGTQHLRVTAETPLQAQIARGGVAASGEQAVSEAERRGLQERERLLTYSRKNPPPATLSARWRITPTSGTSTVTAGVAGPPGRLLQQRQRTRLRLWRRLSPHPQALGRGSWRRRCRQPPPPCSRRSGSSTPQLPLTRLQTPTRRRAPRPHSRAPFAATTGNTGQAAASS